MGRRPPRPRGKTRLDRFLAARGIGIGRFAKEAGLSRQWLQRVRFGDSEPTAVTIPRFVGAARLLAKDGSINANDLFPLDDDDSQQ